MSLALVVLGISMLLGCPPSNNSTDDTGGGGPDTTAPTLSSSVPANNAMDFSANADIVLTYSEAVLVGTGNITITPSGGAPRTIAVGDAQVTIAGAVVTINPATDLEMDAAYVLTIPADAFMDAAGNKTAVATVSFRTAAVMAFDTTAPTLVSSSPAEGSTTFSADADITLTYSEPVLVGTGEITLEYSDGTTITIMIDVTGSQVSIAGAVVTINPTNDLDLINTHALVIPAGAFMDAAGNTTAENTVSFTTAAALDTAGPELASSMPADNDRNVAVGANIVLTYNEVVQVGTGNITITPSGGAPITIAVTDAQVSFAGAVVTINPTNDLAVSTTYTLTVPAGAIEDASGNAGAEETVSFSTAAAPDTTAPTVVSSVPANNAIDVPVGQSIVLTYSEDVQRGTGSITITPDSGDAISIPVTDTTEVFITGGNVVTIDPPANLVANKMYVVSIPAGALRDLSNNGAGAHTLSFNTPLGSIPIVDSSVPSSGATIGNAANIVLTYTEAVVKGSGSITITPTMPAGTAITIPVSDAQVTIGGADVTINPTNDLVVSTGYTLSFPAGVFESMDDQTDAGVFTLPFMTAAAADDTPPTVDSSVPPNNAIDVPVGQNIVLTYTEAVVKRSGSITLQASGGALVTIPISATQVSVVGNVVTINPTANLVAGTTYALAVPAGGFEDLAGNLSANYELSFSTAVAVDNLAPTLSSSVPTNAATGIDLNTNIVLTYNESVQAGTGNITITPTSGTAITIDVTDTTQVSIMGAVVTINPTADLVDANTLHTVSIPAGAITDNAATPNPAGLSTLTFTTTAPTRSVVLWVAHGTTTGNRVNVFATNCTSGNKLQPKPPAAPDGEGTVTRRFLATGSGANQNPVNFTVDGNDDGDLLSAYPGDTPVYAAHSMTTDLTDNDLVANSYADLISPDIDLLRTFNQAGLSGEPARGDRIFTVDNPRPPTEQFWTGITNSQSMGSYVPGPACQLGNSGVFWHFNSSGSDVGTFASIGVVAKNPHISGPKQGDVLTTTDTACTGVKKVVCISY